MEKDKLLNLMTDMIKSNGVQVFLCRPGSDAAEDIDYGLRGRLFPSYSYEAFWESLLSRSDPEAIVYSEDELHVFYSVFTAGQGSAEVFLLGPMLFRVPDTGEAIKENGFSESAAKDLSEYYHRIPVIQSLDFWNNMLCTFLKALEAERLPRVVLSAGRLSTLPHEPPKDPGTEDNEFAYKLIEKRYERENGFLDAVASGDSKKAMDAYMEFLSFRLAPRTPDLVRNQKNFAVILNTLLRKTSEQSGVHPFLVDEISRSFALQIESALSVDYVSLLFRRMVVAYSELVKEHAHQGLSPVTRKAVSYIDANYQRPISCSSLAALLSVTPGYLSRAFSKEMEETVTDYINKTRIKASMRMLAENRVSITQIAFDCGFSSPSYFARLFRRFQGMSPAEFRESLRK